MIEHGTSDAVVVEPRTGRPVGVLSTLDIAGILAGASAEPRGAATSGFVVVRVLFSPAQGGCLRARRVPVAGVMRWIACDLRRRRLGIDGLGFLQTQGSCFRARRPSWRFVLAFVFVVRRPL